MILSLRVRLISGIVVLMACGLLVADVAGVLLLRSYLLQRLDQQLSTPFERPGGPPGGGPRDPCASRPADTSGSNQQLPTSFVITTVDTSGALRCRLPADVDVRDVPDLAGFGPDQLAVAAADGGVRSVPSSAGSGGWRVRVTTTETGYTVVGVSVAEVQATVRRLELVTATTSLVILALAATGGFLLVRIGLRPLTDIEVTADAIARGDLSQRIDSAPVTTEVGRLSAALNAMLAQIEGAFTDRADSEARLRRFVADASHELRTPVATIRGHAELYRQGVATDPADVARLLDRIEKEAVRMGALVEDLLLLARLDAAPRLDRHDVDLLSLAADAVVDARAQDPGRPIVLHPRTDLPWVDEPPVVEADEARLRQVLANLLSNAVRHTPAGTPVEVEVGVREDTVWCRVVDHGSGLSAPVAARVFERFFRGDPGRTRGAGGTGLGLSIVASLVEAHDGRVWHEPTVGGGSTFVVGLALRKQGRANPAERAST